MLCYGLPEWLYWRNSLRPVSSLLYDSIPPASALKGFSGNRPGNQYFRVLLTGFRVCYLCCPDPRGTVHRSANIISTVWRTWWPETDRYVSLDKEIIADYGDVLVEQLLSDPWFRLLPLRNGLSAFRISTVTRMLYGRNEDLRYYLFPPRILAFHRAYRLTLLTDAPLPRQMRLPGKNVWSLMRWGQSYLMLNRVTDCLTAAWLSDSPWFPHLWYAKSDRACCPTAKEVSRDGLNILTYTVWVMRRKSLPVYGNNSGIDPLYPVQIDFYDQLFDQTYRTEKRTSTQIILFSLIAVSSPWRVCSGWWLSRLNTAGKRSAWGKYGASVREILLLLNRKLYGWRWSVSGSQRRSGAGCHGMAAIVCLPYPFIRLVFRLLFLSCCLSYSDRHFPELEDSHNDPVPHWGMNDIFEYNLQVRS